MRPIFLSKRFDFYKGSCIIHNMTTIDQLLINIVTDTSSTIEELIPSRDAKVLRSLITGIHSQQYITENQSKLLSKILRENHKKIPNFEEDILDALRQNQWERTFRKVEQFRKFYISKDINQESRLTIDFTFSSTIRKSITQHVKKIEGLIQENNGKLYYAELTEKNIVTLYELLIAHEFDVEPTIKEHYDIIKSWVEHEVKDQFIIDNISNTNFQSCLEKDLGVIDALDENIIIDRSKRYHYNYKTSGKSEKIGGDLTTTLANRTKTKIWVDKKLHSLDAVIQSLVDLNRFPVMVVFDNYNSVNSLKTLENLSEILENKGLDTSVGIYFRLPSESHGTQFNKVIADKQYNQYLGTDTKVVGVQSGKIPKFFIGSAWKPMSVLVVDATLRHTKTAVYANCCDLIISYSDSRPLMESNQTWE